MTTPRLWIFLALVACGGSKDDEATPTDAADTDTDTDTDADTDTDTDTDSDTDTDTDTDTGGAFEPWAASERTGYTFDGLQSSSWDGGENLVISDASGAVVCEVDMGTGGSEQASHTCSECVRVWDIFVGPGTGTGTDCASYGLDQPFRVDSRLIGYAPSSSYGGGTTTDALMAFDTDLQVWRPIGTVDPATADYALFPGEPTWERP